MQQSIIDFLSGLSKSITQGFSEALKHGGIGNFIEEGIEKFRKKIATQVYKACRETLSNKITEQPRIGIFAKSVSAVAFQEYSSC